MYQIVNIFRIYVCVSLRHNTLSPSIVAQACPSHITWWRDPKWRDQLSQNPYIFSTDLYNQNIKNHLNVHTGPFPQPPLRLFNIKLKQDSLRSTYKKHAPFPGYYESHIEVLYLSERQLLYIDIYPSFNSMQLLNWLICSSAKHHICKINPKSIVILLI